MKHLILFFFATSVFAGKPTLKDLSPDMNVDKVESTKQVTPKPSRLKVEQSETPSLQGRPGTDTKREVKVTFP